MKIKKIFKLFLSILVCELAGVIGSFATNQSVSTWYQNLKKTPISPPDWVFAPVWTIIFALMGVSLFLILEGKGKNKKKALWFFSVQLFLNILWSFLFFGFQLPLIAFLEIIILWIFIFLTIKEFSKINKQTKWLFLPYIIWVSFAALLNFWIWFINY